jgi:hypothetical protein
MTRQFEVNAVATKAKPYAARKIGPTITGMVDLRETNGFVIQDLAVPGPSAADVRRVSSRPQRLSTTSNSPTAKPTGKKTSSWIRTR